MAIDVNRERAVEQFPVRLDDLPATIADDDDADIRLLERFGVELAERREHVVLALAAPEMTDEEDDGPPGMTLREEVAETDEVAVLVSHEGGRGLHELDPGRRSIDIWVGRVGITNADDRLFRHTAQLALQEREGYRVLACRPFGEFGIVRREYGRKRLFELDSRQGQR